MHSKNGEKLQKSINASKVGHYRIIQLLKISFPEWAAREKPLDYWNWKYRDNPLGSSVIVALDKGRVIGVGYNINLNIKIGPRVFRSQYGDDFATHPDYRGMGVYSRLVKEDNEVQGKYIQFDFFLLNNPIVIDASKKDKEPTRFKFPYSLTHLFRVKDMSSHLKRKAIKNQTIVRGGFGVIKAMNRAKNMVLRKLVVPKDIKVQEAENIDDDYFIFWERVKDRHNFILEKNANYLNWRFKAPRGGSCIIREARSGGDISGFAALEVGTTKDYSEGYIVDLLTLSERAEVYNALLEDACNYFDDLGLNAVNIQLVEGHPL